MKSTSFQFLIVLTVPTGHSGEADAVPDDREDLAIRKGLAWSFSLRSGGGRVEAFVDDCPFRHHCSRGRTHSDRRSGRDLGQ